MQNIEVDDIVELTGFTVMKLSQVNPELCKTLADAAGEAGTTGTVREIGANHVLIDFGNDTHLRLDVPATHINQAVQLVQKCAQVQRPVTEDSEKEQVATWQTSRHALSDIFGVPMKFEFAHIPLGQQTIQEEIPTRIRTAQWVMVQFINLKQYGIAQDLLRTPDDHAKRPDPTGEHWDKHELRAVQIELSVPEESLYNAALAAVKSWICTDQSADDRTPVDPPADPPADPLVD